MFLLTIFVLLAVEGYFVYQVKGIDVFYKKIKCYLRKIDFEILRQNFRKKDILLTQFLLLMVKNGWHCRWKCIIFSAY